MSSSRSSGSSTSVPSRVNSAETLLAPVRALRLRAHRHRHGGQQRAVRQLVAVLEVGAQGAAGHGQHHVVDRGAGGGLDLLDVVEVHLGERDRAVAGDGAVERRARRGERRRHRRPLAGPADRADHALDRRREQPEGAERPGHERDDARGRAARRGPARAARPSSPPRRRAARTPAPGCRGARSGWRRRRRRRWRGASSRRPRPARARPRPGSPRSPTSPTAAGTGPAGSPARWPASSVSSAYPPGVGSASRCTCRSMSNCLSRTQTGWSRPSGTRRSLRGERPGRRGPGRSMPSRIEANE